MNNIYTPPLTTTVFPPNDHRRTTPDFTQTTDEDRKAFFTNWNEKLVKKSRQLNFIK